MRSIEAPEDVLWAASLANMDFLQVMVCMTHVIHVFAMSKERLDGQRFVQSISQFTRGNFTPASDPLTV